MIRNEYCVFCGEDIPEGTQICMECEEKLEDMSRTGVMYESNETAAIKVELSSIRLFDTGKESVNLTDDDIHCLLNYYTLIVEHRKKANEDIKQKKATENRFRHW